MPASTMVNNIIGVAKDIARADEYLVRTMKKHGQRTLSGVIHDGDVDQLFDVKGEVENMVSSIRYLTMLTEGFTKAYEKKIKEMDRAIEKAA